MLFCSYCTLSRGQITQCPKMTHKVERTRRPSRQAKAGSFGSCGRIFEKLSPFRTSENAPSRLRPRDEACGPAPSQRGTVSSDSALASSLHFRCRSARVPSAKSKAMAAKRTMAATRPFVHVIASAASSGAWQATVYSFTFSWPTVPFASARTSSEVHSLGRHSPRRPLTLDWSPNMPPPGRCTLASKRQYCMPSPSMQPW
mmetsp:Transcript_48955/g.129403  ORF Transcript_48955/g.129403 Transcript_48955/m.129403 type:complete len:201 (+) Transcript_48955:758-1360(+)